MRLAFCYDHFSTERFFLTAYTTKFQPAKKNKEYRNEENRQKTVRFRSMDKGNPKEVQVEEEENEEELIEETEIRSKLLNGENCNTTTTV